MPVGLQLWHDRGGKYQILLADGTLSVFIVEVKGERFVVAAQYRDASTEEEVAEMYGIIESIDQRPKFQDPWCCTVTHPALVTTTR